MSWLWPVGLVAAAIVALAQGCALIALFAALGRLLFRERSNYQVLVIEDGPALGSRLADLSGRDARTDAPLSAAQFLGRKLVLLFIRPDCHACDDLLRAISARQRDRRDEVAFLIVVPAPSAEAARYLQPLLGIPVLADPDERIVRAWSVERTPLGLLVDAWGYVRMKGIVNTPEQLAGLIAGQGRSMEGLSWTLASASDEPAAEAAGSPGATQSR
jgi:AhpC/TSA family